MKVEIPCDRQLRVIGSTDANLLTISHDGRANPKDCRAPAAHAFCGLKIGSLCHRGCLIVDRGGAIAIAIATAATTAANTATIGATIGAAAGQIPDEPGGGDGTPLLASRAAAWLPPQLYTTSTSLGPALAAGQRYLFSEGTCLLDHARGLGVTQPHVDGTQHRDVQNAGGPDLRHIR